MQNRSTDDQFTTQKRILWIWDIKRKNVKTLGNHKDLFVNLNLGQNKSKISLGSE